MPSGGNRSTRRGYPASAHPSQMRPPSVLRTFVARFFQHASQYRTAVAVGGGNAVAVVMATGYLSCEMDTALWSAHRAGGAYHS